MLGMPLLPAPSLPLIGEKQKTPLETLDNWISLLLSQESQSRTFFDLTTKQAA